MTDGGYDDGYRNCACFWGTTPGSLVAHLVHLVGPAASRWRVVDLGCGEGKNTAFLAALGAQVAAVDISELAIDRARTLWDPNLPISWRVGDVRSYDLPADTHDLVIAYGIMHCLANEAEVASLVHRIRLTTKPGGYVIVCSFNDRRQELEAHPGFHPLLLTHERIVAEFEGWDLILATDSDLHEEHPHNQIRHCHSMTRMIVRRPV
jgi:tellurite methyltransferase